MKRKILFIDDDKELSEEMVDLLSSEGYGVQAAFDGLEGVRLINKHPYDVILLDIKMPFINGLDLLKIMENTGFKGKVILMSGKPFLEKEIKKLGLGPMISGFISKPYDVNRLLDILQTA